MEEDDDYGIFSTHIYSSGKNADLLKSYEIGKIGLHMDGKAVYKFAVKSMSDSIIDALKYNSGHTFVSIEEYFELDPDAGWVNKNPRKDGGHYG